MNGAFGPRFLCESRGKHGKRGQNPRGGEKSDGHPLRGKNGIEAAGERVVVRGNERLQPGQQVNVSV